jgi:signal transduction histidine kinase
VAPQPIAFALGVGVLYNLAFLWRVRRLTRQAQIQTPDERGVLDRELELHALADVGALTLLLLSSGGVRNPCCMFYGFHVVVGAMLGYTRGALLAALFGSCGIALLVFCEYTGLLLSPPLLSPPLWLMTGAALVTIFSLAHFALSLLRYVEKEQGRVLRNYELLLTALDRLQVGLALVAPDGKLLLANRRAAAIHPCPDGRWQLPVGLPPGAAAETGGALRFAYTEDSQEGSETRIAEILALGGFRADGVRAFLYVDRTEATVDEQRAIMLERLASLGRAMQEVAHELNTPLASIQTLAVDLSHAVQSPDAAESVALIVDEARRCQQISRELLSTARTGSSSPVHTVLGEVVRRAIRLTYGQRRGSVMLKGDPDLACVTDSDRLLQILVNLLQNASDASDQPVEVTVARIIDSGQKTEGHAGGGHAYAEISVRDRGPGLPLRVQERLFLPFVSTKPPGKGTGLGLYTCARLAQQLRAELHIENADGRDAGVEPGRGHGVLARLRLPLQPEGAMPS